MSDVKEFKKAVWDFYEEYGRHDLPWRQDLSSYSILVSEVMLQQTQVPRVIEKYTLWMKQFPSFKQLADAPQDEVLREWKGLGYNRRALALHKTAKVVRDEYKENLPREKETLLSFPGIGPYTAGALRAFAWNISDTLIETNIRTVYIHHFFSDETTVSDNTLLPLIEETCDSTNPREWYWALMDYGSHLKTTIGNLSRKSKHYTKQSPFKGSDRELRSRVLTHVLGNVETSKDAVTRACKGFARGRVSEQIRALEKEGFIKEVNGFFVPVK